MADEKIYLIQPSFTGGEISPEVANRIDLDKYQSALLNAENAYIRPYGAVYKRTGSVFCGTAKTENVLLMEFRTDADNAFMLELGAGYIRIWKDGEYTGQEVPTEYTEKELPILRTCQSADIMYIASGTHPVMKLCHYSDTDWRLEEMVIDHPYFDISLMSSVESNAAGFFKDVAGMYTFIPDVTGDYTVVVAAGGGGAGSAGYVRGYGYSNGYAGGRGGLVTKVVALTADTEYTIVVGAAGENGPTTGDNHSGTAGGNSSACGVTATGGGAGILRLIDEDDEGYGYIEGKEGTSYGQGGQGGTTKRNGKKVTNYPAQPGWVSVSLDAAAKFKPSKVEGRDVTITANKNIFSDDMKGGYIKLSHEMPSKTVTVSGTTTGSSSVLVGDSWKILTHGTWTGVVTIQTSSDGGEWKDYRSYKSSDDFNASESGTVETPTYFRLTSTASAVTVDLTSYPYTHEGTMSITSVTSAKAIKGNVIDAFGSTDETEDYVLSAWSPHFGYPRTIGFFQDRLVFGGTKAQPYEVWMSRTGDYANFSVEKVSGTVTDDSAIALAFISRKQAEIQHICPAADLFVLTDSNEWIVSGGSTVTPTKCTNKAQTFRGCTEVPPVSIGNRIVYVQRRSQAVRDMAYTFETDSYDGADLTLLAKHLFRGYQIVDGTYMQDPDSRLYFVRSDGAMICLAYVQDQKVYAWSHLTTDGKYISVTNISGAQRDDVYVAVKRIVNTETITMIEKFVPNEESEDPMDHIILDAAIRVETEEETDTVEVPHLEDKVVTVLADGQHHENIRVLNGQITIPAMAKSFIIGIPYTMKLEIPNVEFQDQRGTSQGRPKKLSKVSLRLINTLGGKIGNGVGGYDNIKYDQFSDQEILLYSGDKEITIPNTTAEKNGRVLIESAAPYPFTLAALVRGVKSID